MIACGIRWRNASPRRPPDAKLSRTLSSPRFSSLLSKLKKKRMMNGKMLMRNVAPNA